jgi:hypothetical protein
MNRTDKPESSPMIRPVIPALLLALAAASCASPTVRQAKPLDRILAGVSDPAMQDRWRKADAAGTLPRIDAIPEPASPLAVRRPVALQVATIEAQRPTIQAGVVATVRPFSTSPVTNYSGTFKVTSNEPGVLIGTLNERDAPLELHYKLPDPRGFAAIKAQTTLNLILRDEVADTALQRRVILYDDQGINPFASFAEGSRKPYSQTIDALQLTIEQLTQGVMHEGGERYLPVRFSYRGKVLTLKPGERGRLGKGSRSLEAYVLDSLEVENALLREGQPYYINVVLYLSAD